MTTCSCSASRGTVPGMTSLIFPLTPLSSLAAATSEKERKHLQKRDDDLAMVLFYRKDDATNFAPFDVDEAATPESARQALRDNQPARALAFALAVSSVDSSV